MGPLLVGPKTKGCMRATVVLAVLCGGAAMAAPSSGSPSAGKPRLFVTALVSQGVTETEAAAVGDAIVDALSGRGLFEVVSTRDVQTLLGAERQKQLLGVCEGDAQTCVTTAAQAITARFILSGQLSRVGAAYQLNLQMLDTEKGQSVARSMRLASDVKALVAQVPYAAAEATGSPLPPPPSRVLPSVLIAAGSAAALAGAIFGMLALSRQAVLNDELCPSGAGATRCDGVSLRPREYYLEQNQQLSVQKSVSLGLLLGGAAVAIVGAVLMPRGDFGPNVRAQLVLHGNGLALVGGF